MARSAVDKDLARRLNAAAALVKKDVSRSQWAKRWEIGLPQANEVLSGNRPIPEKSRDRYITVATELSGLPREFFEAPFDQLANLRLADDATQGIPEGPRPGDTEPRGGEEPPGPDDPQTHP